MPARIRFDILIVDQSPLAHNLYQLLFAGQNRFRISFADEFASLNKRSQRFRPDILLINSNAIAPQDLDEFRFPCQTILIASKGRVDLKELSDANHKVTLIEKPFYPYDLLSVANRLTAIKKQKLSKAKKIKRKAS